MNSKTETKTKAKISKGTLHDMSFKLKMAHINKEYKTPFADAVWLIGNLCDDFQHAIDGESIALDLVIQNCANLIELGKKISMLPPMEGRE